MSTSSRFTSWLPVTVVAALALAVAPFSVHADEGQWLPEQLQGLDFTALKERGLELTAEQIWDGEKGLLSAAVNLNGCSASFVSEAFHSVTPVFSMRYALPFAAIAPAGPLPRE